MKLVISSFQGNGDWDGRLKYYEKSFGKCVKRTNAGKGFRENQRR